MSPSVFFSFYIAKNIYGFYLKGKIKLNPSIIKDIKTVTSRLEKDFVPYEVLDYNKIDKTSELLKTKMSLKEIYEEVFNKVDNL